MAEATDSDNLRARAERLRQLARDLTAQRTQQSNETGASTPGTVGGAVQEPGHDDSGGNLIAVGAERGDVFEESVVSASRIAESPLDAPNSTTTITAQDIRLSGITDLPQLLRRAAGVDVITHSPGHTDIAIRGLATRQANKVLVLLNGRTLRLDFLGAPFFSIIPVQVQDIDRIEVIRGPAAAVYGADAFSGIINIITREPGEGRSRVYVGAGNGGALEVDASLTGRVDRLSYRFGAGYRQTENYSLYTDPNRVDLLPFNENSLMGSQIKYANGDVRYSFGRGNVFRVGGSIADADQATIQGVGILQQMQVNDVVFSQTHAQLNTRVGIGARVYWNSFSGNADSYASAPGSLDAALAMRSDVLDAQLDWNREFKLVIPHNFTMGGGYRLKSADISWFGDKVQEDHGFFFVQDAMRFSEKLRGTINLRGDRHPLFGFRFSPRGSVVYRFLEGQSVRVTAGTAFRSPSFIESYLDYTN
ncbi:MAG: TonB-dependent receptor, partial [Polyangiaceae bacterium]|nr:TonB-dependent receptor [Polyangiaceae bacterium]